MVKKNTSNYYSNFNHYISCSLITFASSAFTLSRSCVEVALTYPPNTLNFSLFHAFKISIFSLENYMR